MLACAGGSEGEEVEALASYSDAEEDGLDRALLANHLTDLCQLGSCIEAEMIGITSMIELFFCQDSHCTFIR